MANLTLANINDLVLGTLKELGPPKFSQIAQSLTRYEIFSKWFKAQKMIVESGYAVQRNLLAKTGGVAAHVGLRDPDVTGISDHMVQITAPFKYARTQWGFGYVETLANRGKSLIFDVFEARRAAAMIDLVEDIEAKAWASPATTESKEPYGIPYWIVKNATTGFNGALPGSHTTLAGISLTTYPTFKNYTAAYVAISKGDLIKKMRTGARATNFQTPLNLPEYRGNVGNRCRYYTNEAVVAGFEEIGESQNENIGRDLASMDGQMTFHKNAIIYVPQLDSDTANPVYQIEHESFKVLAQKGNWLRETEVLRDPERSDWFYIPVNLGYNYWCDDRRRQAVYYVA